MNNGNYFTSEKIITEECDHYNLFVIIFILFVVIPIKLCLTYQLRRALDTPALIKIKTRRKRQDGFVT